MSEKKLNILVLAGLLGIDGYYLFKSYTARKYTMVFIGPYEFPKIIGIGLALLCLITLIDTLRKKEDGGQFRIENLAYVGITAAATCALLLLWQHVGYFYLWAPMFLLILFFTYRDEGGRFSRQNILINLALTAAVTATIFVFFQLLMKIRL